MSCLVLASTLSLGAAPLAAAEVVVNPRTFFPEGPTMWGDKPLYVEYGAHNVVVWDGERNSVLWHQDGCGPSAIVPYGEVFVVTCYDSGQMVVVSAEGATKAAYAADAAGRPLVGPNDGTPDGRGGVFFTTSGPTDPTTIAGKVLHLDASGLVEELADELQQANGVALSPDGPTLYVNESVVGRVNTFRVADDLALSDRRMFLSLGQIEGESPSANPDAIKFGPDGNLHIGEAIAGRILKVDPKGKLLRRFEVPSAAAPNFAFSRDGRTMYVMAVDDMSAAPYPGKVYALPND